VTNLGAFLVYVVIATITPGPNNLVEVNVGLTRGHAAALRTAAGTSLGWGLQVLVCGLGLGALISAVPGLRAAIEAAGLAYLVYLSAKLLTAHKLAAAAPAHGFLGAVRYQWVNPKAISLSLAIGSLFVVHTHHLPVASVLFVAGFCTVLSYPSLASWGLLAASMAERLRDETAVVRFNRVSALALLGMIAWLAATTTW
jgi:threonine/homoserine/homoserine lactone efflux protein